MILIILGHILGDFYVQTDKIAAKKKTTVGYMLLHCFLYSIVMYIIWIILTQNKNISIEITCIISFVHMLIDVMKNKVYEKVQKNEAIIFMLDQVVHFCSLVAIWTLYKNYAINDIFQYSFNGYTTYKLITILTAVLVCWKPTSILVALVFKEIPITIGQADSETQVSSSVENENVKIGSLIGILEREIILLLGLMGQYGAIGFVLTAKSLARYKQLEKKAFAEKYLVGTLLSAFIAFGCVAMCSVIC